jgi:hypothetical protein
LGLPACWFAADRFAADHGLGLELVDPLRALDDGSGVAAGWWCRLLLAFHPSVDLRISALLAVPNGSDLSYRLRSGGSAGTLSGWWPSRG